MGNVLKLISPMPPSVNHYLAHRAIMKNGKPMAMVYETKEAKEYKEKFKQYIVQQVKEQNWISDLNKYQHYYVDEIFYFDRLDNDASNRSKVMHDSITETQLIWADDNLVCERVQHIYYDAKNPHVELLIYPVDYIGIFNNKDELDEFEDVCKSCKRYNRNCSLLNNAKIGRIQSDLYRDVDDKIICNKMSKH